MDNKDTNALDRIRAEVEKIDKKENTIYFFVIDTKGVPSGSLEYIYRLAKIVKDGGYNVTMLYQQDDKDEDSEFVGVGEWLGEEFAKLPHENINNEETSVAPSDVLFIPEIFSNIMMQTKTLPCKRVAIMQNYNFLVEQTPMASQWGDFGIMDAVVNTSANEALLKDIFPYVHTTVVEPYISDLFGETNEPKKMIINVVSKKQDDINKIVKPFYWKYPAYKWVSFRDLRGYPKSMFAQMLREAAITIWVDEDASFGYTPLEAMKSGNIVIAKITNIEQKWMCDENGDLNYSCLWFNSFHNIHKLIATAVRVWISDKVPQRLLDEEKKVLSLYSQEKTRDTMLGYIENLMNKRKEEMEEVAMLVHEKNNVEEEKKD